MMPSVLSESGMEALLERVFDKKMGGLMKSVDEIKREMEEMKARSVGRKEWVEGREEDQKKMKSVVEEVVKEKMKDLEGEGGGEEVRKRIQDMEERLSGMSMGRKGGKVAIFGGLTECDDEKEAEGWIKEKLGPLLSAEIEEVFIKGENFKGIVFVKFMCPKACLKAINFMKMAKLKYGVRSVWANEDKEIQDRAPIAVMFGLKKQLIAWGFARSEIKIMEEEKCMKNGGEVVL